MIAPTTSELRDWLQSRPRYNHLRQSYEEARSRLGAPEHYRPATVSVLWNLCKMTIDMPVRQTQNNLVNVDAFWRYKWPEMFKDLIRATRPDLEVLKPHGKLGFIARLVLRGYPADSGAYFIDIASLTFRIPSVRPKVFMESCPSNDELRHTSLVDFTDDPCLREHPLFGCSAYPLSPSRLTEIFEKMLACDIVFAGCVTTVTSIFHRGRVHPVWNLPRTQPGGARQAN